MNKINQFWFLSVTYLFDLLHKYAQEEAYSYMWDCINLWWYVQYVKPVEENMNLEIKIWDINVQNNRIYIKVEIYFWEKLIAFADFTFLKLKDILIWNVQTVKQK